MPPTKAKLVNLYKKENDPKVKERLLLIIRLREDGQIPFRIVKEMHRSNPWASDWLKRYDDEGIEGLKDRTKSGTDYPNYQKRQPTRLSKNLKKAIWLDHKIGGRVNHKEKRYQVSLHSHISHPSKMGL